MTPIGNEVKLPFANPVGKLITDLSFQSKQQPFPHNTGFDYRPAAQTELTRSPNEQVTFGYEQWINETVTRLTSEGFNPNMMNDLSLIRAVEDRNIAVERVASVLICTNATFPDVNELHKPILGDKNLYTRFNTIVAGLSDEQKRYLLVVAVNSELKAITNVENQIDIYGTSPASGYQDFYNSRRSYLTTTKDSLLQRASPAQDVSPV